MDDQRYTIDDLRQELRSFERELRAAGLRSSVSPSGGRVKVVRAASDLFREGGADPNARSSPHLLRHEIQDLATGTSALVKRIMRELGLKGLPGPRKGYKNLKNARTARGSSTAAWCSTCIPAKRRLSHRTALRTRPGSRRHRQDRQIQDDLALDGDPLRPRQPRADHRLGRLHRPLLQLQPPPQLARLPHPERVRSGTLNHHPAGHSVLKVVHRMGSSPHGGAMGIRTPRPLACHLMAVEFM